MRGKYNSVRRVEARGSSSNANIESSERNTERRLNDERGMTLVVVMLIMSLMLMLGLAVTFTSVSDKAITSNFKNLTSGFYAAEAGINNMRRLLRDDSFVLSSLPSQAIAGMVSPNRTMPNSAPNTMPEYCKLATTRVAPWL